MPQTKAKFYKDAREMIVGLCDKVSGSVSIILPSSFPSSSCYLVIFDYIVIRQHPAITEHSFPGSGEISNPLLAERPYMEHLSPFHQRPLYSQNVAHAPNGISPPHQPSPLIIFSTLTTSSTSHHHISTFQLRVYKTEKR